MSKADALYDVAIIGLGPVGATLANLLGQMGLRVVALERASEISQMPRAVVFDDEAMRIFQSIGLADEMQAISEPGMGAKFVDSSGKTLVHWERPLEKSPNGWFVNYRFNQPELEKTLRDGLSRFPNVSILSGCEATRLDSDADHVQVAYTENGVKQTLETAYVVGCDGGRSFTRAAIGSRFEDLGFHEEWLIIDLLLPERELDPDRYTYHYCGFSRMGSKVFVGSKRKRWEFRLNDDDNRATIQDPAQVWKLLEPWITPNEASLERTALYTFHSTLAETWRRGRVIMAGDAAHQKPPFMGQGMCAGLRDAANLAWKLERVLRKKSPDQLLDTYETERAPHVREYINLTIEFGNLINATARSVTGGNPAKQSDGQQNLKQLRPKLGPGTYAGDDRKRGRLLPQFKTDCGRILDDVVGYKPALLVSEAAGVTMSATERANFSAADVEIGNTPSHELEAWLAENGCVAVLIGADNHILGTARKHTNIRELLPENWHYSEPDSAAKGPPTAVS